MHTIQVCTILSKPTSGVMKNISLEVQEGQIGIALMDMPGRAFNVFSESMMDDLAELIEHAAANLQGLVIGSGKTAFAAGADLEMIRSFADMRFDADVLTMRARFSRLGQLFRRLELLPIPVVAAINGLALGGGLELALACHARVCANGSHASLGLPEVQLGLFPGAGGTQRLPRLIGLPQAMRMLLVGAPVTPERALAEGLVDELCATEHLIERAVARARTLRRGAAWDQPGYRLDHEKLSLVERTWRVRALEMTGVSPRDHQLYPAVDAIIRCVGNGLPLPIDAGCDIEWDIFVELMKDPVAANMVLTCFLNKTAAPKHAAREAVQVQSFCWQAAQPPPAVLARKIAAAEPSCAEVTIVDAATRPLPANAVILADACADSDRWTIRYAGDLAKVEAVEVARSDVRVGSAIAIAMAMGKIPVPVAAAGVMGPVLSCLSTWSQRAPTSFASAVTAVGLEDMASLLDPRFTADTSRPATAADRAAGLTLLTELSLEALDALVSGRIEQPELLDVLTVYGIHFPRWTGGPVSFLAMLQRGECETVGLNQRLQRRIEQIGHALKEKSSYAQLSTR
jgi:3-hydroxyacyl-CoA dehydrogenase / enoyl-CoA hydratase / 3-hydroxybutyryl-CoA epimerase